jgi:putative flippase GtrA
MRIKLTNTIGSFPVRALLSQWIRFSTIGIKANIVYYLLYVLMTAAGLSPAASVTMVYLFGVVYTFWLSKGFVFRDRGLVKHQFACYVLVYGIAWGLNLMTLEFMISRLGINHLVAQGVLVCVFAVLTFTALRFLVFRGSS